MEDHSKESVQVLYVFVFDVLASAAQGDPFKTLFVARLSYEVTEKELKRIFEEFGPVKQIRLVHNSNTGEFLVLSQPVESR